MDRKRWIAIGFACLVVGLSIIFGMGKHYGFKRPVSNSGETWSTVEHEIKEPFDSVVIDAGSRDLNILPSADGGCRLIGQETAEQYWTAEVRDRVLQVKWISESKGFSVSFDISEEEEAVLSLPDGLLREISGSTGSGDLHLEKLRVTGIELESGSGDMALSGLEAETIRLESGSGELFLENISAKSLTAVSSSGDQHLEKLTLSGELSLESSSGGIRVEELRAASGSIRSSSGDQELQQLQITGELRLESGSGEIEFDRLTVSSARVETGSGDVRGSVTAPMDFRASSGSGSVKVPESRDEAGDFIVKTGSGDIKISVN